MSAVIQGYEYYIERWVEVEKWYRSVYPHFKNVRLVFINMDDVRKWLRSVNLCPSEPYMMPYMDAVKYQPNWNIMRTYILDKQGTKCQICGKDPADHPEIDHIMPIKAGGLEFEISNLRVACKKCNDENSPAKARKNAIMKFQKTLDVEIL